MGGILTLGYLLYSSRTYTCSACLSICFSSPSRPASHNASIHLYRFINSSGTSPRHARYHTCSFLPIDGSRLPFLLSFLNFTVLIVSPILRLRCWRHDGVRVVFAPLLLRRRMHHRLFVSACW